MADVLTFIPADTSCVFDGNQMTGFADGTFIVVEREEDSFTKHVGADGEVSRTLNANKSGTATLTLKQTSDSNRILYGLLATDEDDGSGVAEFMLKDNLTNKTYASEAWIQKPPPVEYGKEQSDREWVFSLAKITFTPPSQSPAT